MAINSPIGQAICHYKGNVKQFLEDLFAHFKNGYVYCDSDVFIMARTVEFGKDVEDLQKEHKTPDTWFVWMLARRNGLPLSRSAYKKVFSICPFSMKYIGFHKRDFLKYYDFHVFKRRLLKNGQANN